MQKPVPITYDNLSGSQPAASPHQGHGGPTVNIPSGAWDKNQNSFYEPATITVGEGSTVSWINGDSVVHTVTSKQQGLFDSSIIASGQQWQHTFDEEGEYDYYCILHPWMEGKVSIS
jgi:plastocyanin